MLESPSLKADPVSLELRAALAKWQPYNGHSTNVIEIDLEKLSNDETAAPIFIEFMNAVDQMLTERPPITISGRTLEFAAKDQIITFLQALVESPRLKMMPAQHS